MLNCLCQLRLGGGGRGATARMLAHPSGSAFAESSLRNAFAFLRRIYRVRSRGTRDPTDAATGGLVLRSFSEGGCPPMTVSLFYWPCPFIVSFHDLRSVCHDADETGLYIVRFG